MGSREGGWLEVFSSGRPDPSDLHPEHAGLEPQAETWGPGAAGTLSGAEAFTPLPTPWPVAHLNRQLTPLGWGRVEIIIKYPELVHDLKRNVAGPLLSACAALTPQTQQRVGAWACRRG